MEYNFSLAFTTSSKECQVYSFINQEGLVMTRLKELGRSGNYVLYVLVKFNMAAAMNFFIPYVEVCFFFKLFCLSDSFQLRLKAQPSTMSPYCCSLNLKLYLGTFLAEGPGKRINYLTTGTSRRSRVLLLEGAVDLRLENPFG